MIHLLTMQQKICSRCGKQLSQPERSLDMIQCTPCYNNWFAEVVIPAQDYIREFLDRVRGNTPERAAG